MGISNQISHLDVLVFFIHFRSTGDCHHTLLIEAFETSVTLCLFDQTFHNDPILGPFNILMCFNNIILILILTLYKLKIPYKKKNLCEKKFKKSYHIYMHA